jgi:hypothetical protein
MNTPAPATAEAIIAKRLHALDAGLSAMVNAVRAECGEDTPFVDGVADLASRIRQQLSARYASDATLRDRPI